MEINGKTYTLKYGLRAMFAMEEMTGKPFEIRTMLDLYSFCYACIISEQSNPSLEFSDFIDWCDGHPGVIDEFNEFLAGEMKKRETLGSKKKVTRKARS